MEKLASASTTTLTRAKPTMMNQNREPCKCFLGQEIAPVSRPEENGTNSIRVFAIRRPQTLHGFGHRLKKSKSVSMACTNEVDLSAKGPLDLPTTHGISFLPIIEEDEDFALTGISRWQSGPALQSEGSRKVPDSPPQQSKSILCGPKPPKRQKSME